MKTYDKVMIFIDGQNLIYSCDKFARSVDPKKKFYYDPKKLETDLLALKPDRRLIQTRFYTAIAEVDPERGLRDQKRYESQFDFTRFLENQLKWYVFVKEVKSYPIFCPRCKQSGKEISIECPECHQAFKNPKNKGVDVALATDLLVYGLPERPEYGYDVAILVSGDVDFAPVIKKVKDRRPTARIELAQFSFAVGNDLSNAADYFHKLDDLATRIGDFRPRITGF